MPTPQGLMISAPSSNQGKTVISVGLLGLLRQALGESKVLGAKAGPDYIDTAYLGDARGLALTLDPWAMRPETIQSLISARAESHMLVEGTMGLFDGSADAGKGSSADLAAQLGLPVVLVIDASGMSQSVAAIAHGYASFDPRLSVVGVILNRVGSARHEGLLRDALEGKNIAVFGAVPRDAKLQVSSRHLGLVQAAERPITAGNPALVAQQQWAEALRPYIDLKALMALFAPLDDRSRHVVSSALLAFSPMAGRRVAIATDQAFGFCYGHWRDRQALAFSPLANQPVPQDAEFIFLPGGYPELHLATLHKAERFWRSLREAAAAGVPVYGECGGYMVLGQAIQADDGAWYDAAGLLPLKTSFKNRERHLGYRQLTSLTSTPLAINGDRFRGHEFHYCQILTQQTPNFLAARDATGKDLGHHGHVRGHAFGSFMHLIDTVH